MEIFPIIIFIIKYILCIIFILISVAFFTLLERKILGYVHERVGPNKLFMGGIFQPFRDAMKLFTKDDKKFKDLNLNIYYFFSIFCLFLRMFFWGLLSFWGVLFFSKYSLVLILCVVGIGVYFLLFIGWCSNTKFRLLGSYRSSAQSISYEIIMIFRMLFLFFLYFSFNFLDVFFIRFIIRVFFLSIIVFFLWFLSCFAECNRSPFDFSEGESELVSGFNTEFSGGLFSFIFIGEYRAIILFSFLSSIFFFSYFYLFIFFCLFSFFYLWVRSSFPRLRYDFLMIIAWKSLCILVICSYFLFIFSFN